MACRPSSTPSSRATSFGCHREVPDSGGTAWFIVPGVQYVRKQFVGEAAVQVPVVQDLNGAALEADWIGILSARINF